MYHSITFGDKNTWEDWHLVPETRPVIAPSEPKLNQIDVPGADGVLDITEALTGYPFYNNRQGSLDFIVVNDMYYQVDKHEEWYVTYSKIMNYLHGKKMRMILEDDKQYYYEGRFSVNQWQSDKNYSRITIDYDVGPYKWNLFSSLDDWLWDPFNFITGVIPNPDYKNISVPSWYWDETNRKMINNYRTLDIRPIDIGTAPICPTIYAKFDMDDYAQRIFLYQESVKRPGMYFTVPGYTGARAYTNVELDKGVKIPEYTFRSGMDTDDLKIKYAVRPSRSVYFSRELTCEHCGSKYTVEALFLQNKIYGYDQYFAWTCPNAECEQETHGYINAPCQYDKDYATMNVEIREGRF